MKVHLDINLFMDVLSKRSGWLESVATIRSMKRFGITASVSALTAAVIYFLRKRTVGEMRARTEVKVMLKGIETIPLTWQIIDAALTSQLPDFEDNLQFYSAKEVKADYIITRNKKHFKQDEIPVVTPDEFLKIIGILK